jgi:NADPH:quinone reductase-like Zn-dependent oxidoreductase
MHMKAIGLAAYGGPEVLIWFELPEPHAGPGEVRVRVRAAGVNPVDAMLRQGLLAAAYRDVQPPFVPGMEVAGTIDEIGTGVDAGYGLTVGVDVVGLVDSHGSRGGYSEYIVLQAESVTRMPAGTTFSQSASFLNNALTARNALDAFDLAKGSTLLVTGAAGAVGGYLTQLASADGIQVLAVASEADEALVRAFGAHTFIPRGDAVVDRVLATVPGGVDAVADAALLHERILPAIRDGGQLGTFRGWSDDPGRDITVHPLNVRQRAEDHAAIVQLRDQVEAGLLTLRVAETLPMGQAAQAHRKLDRGGLRGRIILELPAGANS